MASLPSSAPTPARSPTRRLSWRNAPRSRCSALSRPTAASGPGVSCAGAFRPFRRPITIIRASDYDHQGFLDIIKTKGGVKKLAIVFEQSPFSIASKDFAEKLGRDMGLTVESFGYTPGSQDFRSIIERIVSFEAQGVSMGGYYEPAVALTRHMIER